MRNYQNHLTGTAGEMAVGMSLCLKGWIPSLTTNNCPTLDLFCFNPDTKESVAIQIKTTRDKEDDNGKFKKNNSFMLGSITHATIEEDIKNIITPFIFVHIDVKNNIKYYILSKQDIVNEILAIDKYCREIRKRKNAEFSPKEQLAIPLSYLEKYENQWDNLWLSQSKTEPSRETQD